MILSDFHDRQRHIGFLKGGANKEPSAYRFLAITHPHFQKLMNERKTPFMAFADYDVAPYGFNDFFDALQMFVSDDTVGMGIGNLDFKYPMFGIPTIRFQS